MRCDVIAEGIIAAAKELNLVLPIIVRLQVTENLCGQQAEYLLSYNEIIWVLRFRQRLTVLRSELIFILAYSQEWANGWNSFRASGLCWEQFYWNFSIMYNSFFIETAWIFLSLRLSNQFVIVFCFIFFLHAYF